MANRQSPTAWYFSVSPMSTNVGLEIVKTGTLRTYNGAAGYSLSQGQ